MHASCECCMMSSRGYCDDPILRPGKAYGARLPVCVSLCVTECD